MVSSLAGFFSLLCCTVTATRGIVEYYWKYLSLGISPFSAFFFFYSLLLLVGREFLRGIDMCGGLRFFFDKDMRIYIYRLGLYWMEGILGWRTGWGEIFLGEGVWINGFRMKKKILIPTTRGIGRISVYISTISTQLIRGSGYPQPSRGEHSIATLPPHVPSIQHRNEYTI